MRKVAFFIGVLSSVGLSAQQIHDDNINKLIEKYSSEIVVKSEINVQIDVEGMKIPNKTILVDFEEGKKPKVTGKGLALLPKKGMINQFNELFTTNMQAISMGEKDAGLFYKLVSLDEKSNWVTADIVFDEDNFQIYESVINTRKQGSLKAMHSYVDSKYPSKSIITFEVRKFKIPLRFIGRQDRSNEFPEKDEKVVGTITLLYTYID